MADDALNQNTEPTPEAEATPFSEQDLYRDPWTAVYQPIPADADATLLELARIAVSRCQASVAGGEPELVNRLFTPTARTGRRFSAGRGRASAAGLGRAVCAPCRGG